jgi:hypothetical protein
MSTSSNPSSPKWLPDTNGFTNVTPVWRHIKRLQARGMTIHTIADAAGVSFSSVQALSRHRYLRTVRPIARAILSVKDPDG